MNHLALLYRVQRLDEPLFNVSTWTIVIPRGAKLSIRCKCRVKVVILAAAGIVHIATLRNIELKIDLARLLHDVDGVYACKRRWLMDVAMRGCDATSRDGRWPGPGRLPAVWKTSQNIWPISFIGQSRRDIRAGRDKLGRSFFNAQIGQADRLG